MATRYSGNATVRMEYRDGGQAGFYSCHVAVEGRSVWSGTVTPPAVGFGPGVAYDSPEAYDQTARAALSIAQSDAEPANVIEPDFETIDHDGCRIDQIAVRRAP